MAKSYKRITETKAKSKTQTIKSKKIKILKKSNVKKAYLKETQTKKTNQQSIKMQISYKNNLNTKRIQKKDKKQLTQKINIVNHKQSTTKQITISNQKAQQIKIYQKKLQDIQKSLKITILLVAQIQNLDVINKDEQYKFNFVYIHDADQILKSISQDFQVQTVYLQSNVKNAINQIKLMEDKTDVFINLYDLQDQTGQKILEYMESNNISFTGAGARMYFPTRQTLKKTCSYSGVPTPQHTFISFKDLQNIKQIIKNFKYPLFVKPKHGYGSIGIHQDSIVYNQNDLKKKCKQIIQKYGQALVEKYVDGRQFTVLIAGNKRENFVFSPAEYMFDKQINNKFISFQNKWRDGGDNTKPDWKLLNLKDQNQFIINNQLQYFTKVLFQTFDDNGYARIDFRQDKFTGKLYALDYNANCSIFYKNAQYAPDSIIRLMGLKKDFLMRILIQKALQRSKKSKELSRFTLEYGTNNQIKVVAKCQIKENQVVYTDEMCPVRLVTKDYVQKNWTIKQIDNFSRQAWPVGFNTYAILDQNLKSWRPLNHSCDPNCWMQGLSVVARKIIKKGEQLTINFSTFKPQFYLNKCSCQSKCCRKQIKPCLYKEKWFQNIYKGHCSPYIQSLMATKQKSPMH